MTSISAPSPAIVQTADELLLVHANNGDTQAFERLFTRHYPRVFRIAYRIVGNREDAEELALDTFMKLAQLRLSADKDMNVAGWLYRTTTNAAFNAVRSRKRRLGWIRKLLQRELSNPHSFAADPADDVERQETSALVRSALAKLPERQRSALVLRASGLSYREIAASIEVETSSIGTLLARGERKLRDVVEQESRAE